MAGVDTDAQLTQTCDLGAAEGADALTTRPPCTSTWAKPSMPPWVTPAR